MKEQLREKGITGDVVKSDDIDTERNKRINEMIEYAQERRKQRAWQRVNEAISNNDQAMLSKLEELEK